MPRAAAATATVTTTDIAASVAAKAAAVLAVKATAVPKTKKPKAVRAKPDPAAEVASGPAPRLVTGSSLTKPGYHTACQIASTQMRAAMAKLADHARGGVVTGEMLTAVFGGLPLPPAAPAARGRAKKPKAKETA